MKKTFLYLILLLCLVMTGCAKGKPAASSSEQEDDLSKSAIIAEGYTASSETESSATKSDDEIPSSEPTTTEASTTEASTETSSSAVSSTSTETEQKEKGPIYYADVYEYLTLRDGPTTTSNSIALLVPKQPMYVIDKTTDQMWEIETIGIQTLRGFVEKDYLMPEGGTYQRSGQEKPTEKQAVDNTIYYAKVKNSLVLRKTASTSGKAIGYVGPMTAMRVLEKQDKMWYVFILESGKTGWVNSDFLTTKYSYPYSKKNKGKEIYADVSDFLTLRSKPSTSSSPVVRLNPFTPMTIIEESKDWCRVKVANGVNKSGWVFKKYTAKSYGAVKRCSSFPLIYEVNGTSYLTLRKTPSSKGQKVTSIPEFDLVSLIDQGNGTFWHVDYGGKTGYVLSKYLAVY